MSGKDSSDPVILLTPDRESHRSSSGLVSIDSKPNPGPSRKFVILPPVLPLEERRSYKDMPEKGKIRDIEPPVDEVMGEYRDNQGIDWYYARFQQGIIHRVRVVVILTRLNIHFDALPFTVSQKDIRNESRRTSADIQYAFLQ